MVRKSVRRNRARRAEAFAANDAAATASVPAEFCRRAIEGLERLAHKTVDGGERERRLNQEAHKVLHLKLGYSCLRQHKYVDARDAAGRVLALDPGSVRGLQIRARANHALASDLAGSKEEWAKCVAAFARDIDRLEKIEPSDVVLVQLRCGLTRLLQRHADSKVGRGDFAKAVRTYEQALGHLLRVSSDSLDDAEEAKEEWQALEVSLHVSLSATHMELRNFTLARAAAEKALEIDARHFKGLLLRLQASIALGLDGDCPDRDVGRHFGYAMIDLVALTQLDPEAAEVLSAEKKVRRDLWMKTEKVCFLPTKMDQAVEEPRAVVKHCAAVLDQLGRMTGGEDADSRKDLELAVQLELGRTHLVSGDPAAARAALAAAVALQPSSVQAMMLSAEVHLQRGLEPGCPDAEVGKHLAEATDILGRALLERLQAHGPGWHRDAEEQEVRRLLARAQDAQAAERLLVRGVSAAGDAEGGRRAVDLLRRAGLSNARQPRSVELVVPHRRLERESGYLVGDSVTWTSSDDEVPEFSVGKVVKVLANSYGYKYNALVQFASGTWWFTTSGLRGVMCSNELPLPGGFRFVLRCDPGRTGLSLTGDLIPPPGVAAEWTYYAGFEVCVVDPNGAKCAKSRHCVLFDAESAGSGWHDFLSEEETEGTKWRWDDGSLHIQAHCWKVSEVPVTKKIAAVGMQVVRGRDWKWDDEDGDGSVGKVIALHSKNGDPGWCKVEWSGGKIDVYRIGAEGCHDLFVHRRPAGGLQADQGLPIAPRLMLRACLQSQDPRNGREAAEIAAVLPPRSGEDRLHKLQHAQALLLAGKGPEDRKAARTYLSEVERAPTGAACLEEGCAACPVASCALRLRRSLDEGDLARSQSDSFSGQERWPEALRAYRQALSCAKCCGDTFAEAELHTKLAEICRILPHERKHALKHATRAVELCPWYTRAWLRRGIARFDEGVSAAESLEDFQRAGHEASLQRVRLEDLDTWKDRARAAVAQGPDRKNYYREMELLCDCTAEDIKRRYRWMAVRIHPDKVPEEKKTAATKAFQALQEAYEVLGDEGKRHRYDFDTGSYSFWY